jgi:hypothetical protein
METDACRLQGLDVPNVRYPASVPVRLPPQLPESAIEQEVIAQLLVSVLPKNASQPEAGVMMTSVPPSL